ncbi:DUF805 domain-containing protein [Pontixanthobacter sp.]|uniref:DUF805 domain-containing protein n=1 Tax=Pontixanthobacter sp. TaxID=2792078 RepID=UPI003C7E125F
MLKAIRHNLKNLTNIHGRDGRKVFWLYLLFVVILNIAISLLASIPMMVAAMNAGFEVAQTGDSAAAEAAIFEQVVQYAPTAVWISFVVAILNIVLLFASFIRRTHDTGLPGLIVAIPLVIHLVWMFISYRQIDGIEETMRAAVAAETGAAVAAEQSMQAGMIAQDLLGWLALIIVMLVGIMKSQQGANAYGEGPKQI